METYVEKASTKAAVDPATIIAILTAIAQIVSQFMTSCQQKPTPAELAKMLGTRRGTFAAFRAMQQNGIRPLSHEGRTIYDAMVDAANDATDEDATAFAAMCQ